MMHFNGTSVSAALRMPAPPAQTKGSLKDAADIRVAMYRGQVASKVTDTNKGMEGCQQCTHTI